MMLSILLPLGLLAQYVLSHSSRFTPLDMLQAPRNSDYKPNPSGTELLFTSSTTNISTSSKTGGIYIFDIDKDETIQLVDDIDASNPLWINDHTIIYTSSNDSGDLLMAIDRSSSSFSAKSSSYQVYNFSASVSTLKLLPNLDSQFIIAYTALANQNGTIIDKAQETKLADQASSGGLLYDSLFVTHWDVFTKKQKSNIFTLTLSFKNGRLVQSTGPTNNLQGTTLESPVAPFGDEGDYDLSLTHLAFISKDPEQNPATSTTTRVNIKEYNSDEPPLRISLLSTACSSPRWSPDGIELAWLEMRVPGYESDRRRVIIYNRITNVYTLLTESWDRSPSDIVWSKNGLQLYLVVEDAGLDKLFVLYVRDKADPQPLTEEFSISKVYTSRNDELILTASSLARSSFALRYNPQGRKSRFELLYNPDRFPLKESDSETFWFESHGRMVQGLLTKPVNFDESVKYPIAFLIHGGPQGAWTVSWSRRWNPAVFANQGFVTVAINPTGSTGYGQDFTDAIAKHWGDLPYEDLMTGFDYVCQKFKYVNGDKAVALGASYGGYMVNWIQAQKTKPFKALVTHDGVFNTFNTFYTTDELYFPHHEFGGYPWESLDIYNQWNPAERIGNFSVPHLVIHGGRDYRLLFGEGLAMFNVLQLKQIPSKFLVFPSENHWVLNPRNSLKWHYEVFKFMYEHIGEDSREFNSQSWCEMVLEDY